MIQQSLQVAQGVQTTAALVDSLVERFDRQGIVYCHWKSNIALSQAASGWGDLDLLVGRGSLQAAVAILLDLGFRAAVARRGGDPPGIRHYYGLDPESKRLIHVHLFSRVLTGESYVKGHLLPLEGMLLENVRYVGRMRVPSKPAELVLFTLRSFIKYGSLLDLLALGSKSAALQAEARWLRDGDDLSQALALLREHCPVVDERLFVRCVEALEQGRPLMEKVWLARQVRRRLGVYAKHSYVGRLLAYVTMLWAEARRRIGAKQENKVPQAGGAVIAIVGADATGKSTLVAETARWLGDAFAVRTIHTGKPPSSGLMAPVNLALALFRRWAHRGHRSEQAPTDEVSPTQHRYRGMNSLPYALRAVALACDRQRLIVRARRLAAQGEIIVCDRYPSRVLGAMDSPRLLPEPRGAGAAVALYNRLARVEGLLYERIPPPDIVLRLQVSLETAKRRNRERDGQEPDGYLEARHRGSQAWHMPGARYVYNIDTERSLEETIDNVKQAVWGSL